MCGRTLFRYAVLASLLPTLTGCAALFVHGPPKNHGELTYFECTESRLAPILDLAVAGSIFLAGSEEPYQAPPEYYGQGSPYGPPETDQSANILTALVYGISGATGMQRVSACRKAKEELRERLRVAPPLEASDSAAR